MSNAAPIDAAAPAPTSRELLTLALGEADELEHRILGTCLYAAFSLNQGVEEGLTAPEKHVACRRAGLVRQPFA